MLSSQSARNAFELSAIQLSDEMLKGDVTHETDGLKELCSYDEIIRHKPDLYAITRVLHMQWVFRRRQACAYFVVRNGLESNLFVPSVLMDMYGNCAMWKLLDWF